MYFNLVTPNESFKFHIEIILRNDTLTPVPMELILNELFRKQNNNNLLHSDELCAGQCDLNDLAEIYLMDFVVMRQTVRVHLLTASIAVILVFLMFSRWYVAILNTNSSFAV